MKKTSHKMPKKIVILYSDVKKEFFLTVSQYLTEKDAKKDARVIASHIKNLGFKVDLAAGNNKLAGRLAELKPDLVLNLVDSFRGNEMAAGIVPGALDLLGYKYTGVGFEGCQYYNKFICNDLLLRYGIAVPPFQLVHCLGKTKIKVPFPIITKLSGIHGSVELTRDAISHSLPHLKKRLGYLLAKYQQPVLVEKFIVGQEISAFLIEEGRRINVYLGQKEFPKQAGDYQFADFSSQWELADTVYYKKYQNKSLEKIMVKIFQITKMRDYGKIDIRLDKKGKYYVIDVNHNPFFGPKELGSAMADILEMYGLDYGQTLKKVLFNAYNRKMAD